VFNRLHNRITIGSSSGWFLTAIVPGPFGSEYGGYLVGPGANLSDAILTDQNLGG